MVKWSSSVIEALVAPDLTSFTEAQIPDLSANHPQAEHWLANHFLNNALRGSFGDRVRQAVVACLRRAHRAFVSYHEARRLTRAYLDGNDPYNPRLQRYYDAIGAWESFILQVAMAFDILRWLNQGTGVFEKNDGSAEQRLYSMANHVKHTASCIESGQCTTADTVPLWLNNHGLVSYGVSVTFAEAASVLSALASLADGLQDPASYVRGSETQSNA